MRILRSEPFLKQYIKLSPDIRKKVDRTILYLAQNSKHPSLHAKKMVHEAEIWEARVDIHYRVTFQRNGEVILLRRVGTHEIYKRP